MGNALRDWGTYKLKFTKWYNCTRTEKFNLRKGLKNHRIGAKNLINAYGIGTRIN